MIRPLKMRELPPDRRRSWTQEVSIEGQNFCLTVSEYDDDGKGNGRPCEIWIDAAKVGSFVNGILSILSRTVSISLQCGESLEAICHSLRGNDFAPSGVVVPINGTHSNVTCCDSVTDWIASELEDRYTTGKTEAVIQPSENEVISAIVVPQGDPYPILPPPPDHTKSPKPAGYTSESVWA